MFTFACSRDGLQPRHPVRASSLILGRSEAARALGALLLLLQPNSL